MQLEIVQTLGLSQSTIRKLERQPSSAQLPVVEGLFDASVVKVRGTGRQKSLH